jgi:hypothetical protein
VEVFMLPAHRKTRGDIAEALLIAIATALGFTVSRPFGDNARYDYVLDWHGHLSRVQLKSAWTLGRNLGGGKRSPGAPSLRSKGGQGAQRREGVRPERALSRASAGRGQRQRSVAAPSKGRYQIATGCGPKKKRRYTSRDIDFLIAYIADGSPGCPIAAGSFGCPIVPGGKNDRGKGGKGGTSCRRHETSKFGAPKSPAEAAGSVSPLVTGTWYILPAKVIEGCLSVYFTANPTRSRFAPYRNAWNLLRKPQGAMT